MKDLPPDNFDGRTTLTAFAVVALVLSVLELAVRFAAPNLSGNVAHIRNIEPLLGAVARSTNEHAVFVGNSLINNAVQPQQFSDILSEATRRRYVTSKIVPDGSVVWDWRCILGKLPDARPGDILIVGYAWAQLADQQPINVSRTLGLVCPLSELPSISRYRDVDISDWLEGVFARISLTYVLRERLSSAILSRLVPGYRAQTQRLNDIMREQSTDAARDIDSRTYSALLEALREAQAKGYRVTIVAMPTKAGYPVDPRLPRIASDFGVQYLDRRDIAGIAESSFVDSIHLGQAGAEVFTARIARDVLRNELRFRY